MCVCGEKVGEIPVPDNNLRSLALNHILVVELRLFFPPPYRFILGCNCSLFCCHAVHTGI